MFRELIEHPGPSTWAHMQDCDLSFERLVDAAQPDLLWTPLNGPDYQMRCKLSDDPGQDAGDHLEARP
jgi:hypothetical protein